LARPLEWKWSIALAGPPSHREADPSTGNDKRIHEFEITDTKIDKALAPDDLTNKERASIVEAVVDVTALPGVFSSSSDTDVQISSRCYGGCHIYAGNHFRQASSAPRYPMEDNGYEFPRPNQEGYRYFQAHRGS
jgi:hypothetical protein